MSEFFEEEQDFPQDPPQEPPEAESPLAQLISQELGRRARSKAFRKAVGDTLRVLVVVAAIAVLLSTVLVPVFRIYGSSMDPTLKDGEIVVAYKSGSFKRGDIIAFYFNNKVLIKRVIAQGGDVVDFDENGNVLVNGQALYEPYVVEAGLGESDLDLPYTVPDERLFVLGDYRATSVDSRSSMIGPVSAEQIVGKVAFRVWPLAKLGAVR